MVSHLVIAILLDALADLHIDPGGRVCYRQFYQTKVAKRNLFPFAVGMEGVLKLLPQPSGRD